jgi:hypothetical protein
MTSCLDLVMEQFPDLKHQVDRLFGRNPAFRELCEDYETCTAALSRQPSPSLQREYAALRLRLETELLRFLHDDSGSSGDS